MVYSHLVSYSIASLPVQALASTVNEENLPDLKYQFDTIDVDKWTNYCIEEIQHVRFRVFHMRMFCAGTRCADDLCMFQWPL